MNKIDFPRTGVDGIIYSRKKIENEFLQDIQNDIRDRLIDKRPFMDSPCELKTLNWLIKDLRHILIAKPKDLNCIQKFVDIRIKKILKNDVKINGEIDKFGKIISDCFNYNNYRKDVLVKLAQKLNIKCCPYCNHHYTLYIESEKNNKAKKVGVARFQFDHFYNKSHYPLLSMSLYNLIPSCPACNISKSTMNLPIEFNPYYGEIASYFKFRVKDPLNLYLNIKDDNFKIEVEWDERVSNKIDTDGFEQMTQLKAQYIRHRDLAKEIFAKAYLKHYYNIPENFMGITGFSDRLRHGTYMNPKDIDKRPLTKFYQDLWEQASLERSSLDNTLNYIYFS